MKSPLTIPAFRYLWLGQAVSTFGDRFSTIAIPILVYRLTGSSTQLGFAFLAQVVATLVFGLYAGALSDRRNRVETMVLADLARAVLVLLVPASLYFPISLRAHLLLIYLLSFLIAGVTQFFVPAKVGLIPQLVKGDQLIEANSLDQGTSKVSEFLGYALAGFLIAAVGATVAFVIDAATFMISALLTTQIVRYAHLEEPTIYSQDVRRPSMLSSVREGLSATRRTPILRATVTISLIAPLAIGAIQPLQLVFAQNVLETNEAGYGLMQAAIALGLAIGILLIGRYAGSLPRGYLLSGGVMLMGLFLLGAVILPIVLASYWGAGAQARLLSLLPFFALMAVANGAIFLGIRTIVQENAPPDAIGRVFSVINVASSVSIAGGAALAFLADIAGISLMMLFWALYMLIIGAAAVFWKPLYARVR